MSSSVSTEARLDVGDEGATSVAAEVDFLERKKVGGTCHKAKCERRVLSDSMVEVDRFSMPRRPAWTGL